MTTAVLTTAIVVNREGVRALSPETKTRTTTATSSIKAEVCGGEHLEKGTEGGGGRGARGEKKSGQTWAPRARENVWRERNVESDGGGWSTHAAAPSPRVNRA